jgi:2Fe-2S ferredoxin
MAQITFIAADNQHHNLNIDTGRTLMEGAVQAGVAGIDADCGGTGACGTCHIHVAKEWIGRLPPPSPDEASMLEFVVEPDETSRLSCQIKVDDTLDGLVIRVPQAQH